MTYIDRYKRERLWRHKQYVKQKGRCFYCNCLMDQKKYAPGETIPPHAATREHLRSRADGGTNAASNLVLACYKCNQEKGSDSCLPNHGTKNSKISSQASTSRHQLLV